MNCEANGCTAALTPKSLPGSAMGGPSPWVVTDVPPGWCVRQVENTDLGSSRVVVLCPLHGAGNRVEEIRAELERDHGPAACIVELEAEVARLTEIAATADADRVPLAMDLENARARINELEARAAATDGALRRIAHGIVSQVAPAKGVLWARDIAREALGIYSGDQS